jgi:hypothetical protein
MKLDASFPWIDSFAGTINCPYKVPPVHAAWIVQPALNPFPIWSDSTTLWHASVKYPQPLKTKKSPMAIRPPGEFCHFESLLRIMPPARGQGSYAQIIAAYPEQAGQT